MTRQVLYYTHWALGITVGFVLAIMGVTGALLSLEDEIVAMISPSSVVVPIATPPLALDELATRIGEQRASSTIGELGMYSDAARAITVRLHTEERPDGKHPGVERSLTYVDPFTGLILGPSNGGSFFSFVEELHRFLALPASRDGKSSAIGQQITGFATITLIFFGLSGLYLRWPRRPLSWRSWLRLDLHKTGRNLYREIHAVTGTWLLLCYLLTALTGLTWSYTWYRGMVVASLGGEPISDKEWEDRAKVGLTADNSHGRIRHDGIDAPAEEQRTRVHGKRQQGRGPAPTLPSASLDTIWARFLQSAGSDFGTASISMPRGSGPVRIEHVRQGTTRGGIRDRYFFDARTGALTRSDLVATRPLGRTIIDSMLAFHSGAFLGLPGRLIMMMSSFMMPVFLVTGLLLYGKRRSLKSRLPSAESDSPDMPMVDGAILVVHASQTGTSEHLARMTAKAFADAGRPVRLMSMSRLRLADLRIANSALFIVSTYGDGEPPDMARAFARHTLREPVILNGLPYAVLAIGDREYPDFCRFGHEMDDWLSASGGQRLWDHIDVDGEDRLGVRQWYDRLAELGAHVDPISPQEHAFGWWTLKERRLLNPGSLGRPIFLLRFASRAREPAQWQAGDIAEILPCAHFWSDPDREADYGDGEFRSGSLAGGAPARDYSIASISEDGVLDIVVRQIQRSDGSLGTVSGWLTKLMPCECDVPLRIRRNSSFHQPRDRPLILIGNGTGIAGLRAHLRELRHEKQRGCWLIFGERQVETDALFRNEIDEWLSDGTLARFDPAWSRDGGPIRYVQHVVQQHAFAIKSWVLEGAAIMVCGSLEGMAPGVDLALRGAIGSEVLDALAAEGRYRRDVY